MKLTNMAEPQVSGPAEPEPTSEAEATPLPEGEGFSQQEKSIWITVYSFWIILIIGLNIATIISLVLARVINKKLSNLFLLSLIVARTLIAFLVMPARITGLFSNQILGATLCKLCHFSGHGSSAASVFSTCAVAIAKYLEVKHPEMKMSMRRGLIGIIIIWAVGFLYGFRAYFLNGLVVVNTSLGTIWACTADPSMHLENRVFIFLDLIALFVIPLILILVCYCIVMRELNKSLHTKIFVMIKQVNSLHETDEPPNLQKVVERRMSEQSVSQEKDKIKSIKMLIGVMAAFIVCYAAVYIWKIYVFFAHINTFTSHFLTIEQIVYLISYSNPWINVFMYVYFRNDIRSNFCAVCKKNKCTPTEHQSPLPEKF